MENLPAYHQLGKDIYDRMVGKEKEKPGAKEAKKSKIPPEATKTSSAVSPEKLMEQGKETAKRTSNKNDLNKKFQKEVIQRSDVNKTKAEAAPEKPARPSEELKPEALKKSFGDKLAQCWKLHTSTVIKDSKPKKTTEDERILKENARNVKISSPDVRMLQFKSNLHTYWRRN